MLILVARYKSNANETLSRIFVDGVKVCEGLEDEYREVKVKGETRIPAGVYKVKVRKVGGFHERFSKRFKFHEGMLEICNVPGFTDVLIHTGNVDEDTMGCLLVGSSVEPTANGYRLNASAVAYEKLYRMVINAAKEGSLQIEYQDHDRAA